MAKKVNHQLFKENPNLARCWDFDLNNGPPALALVIGSALKAHWVCDLGHRFSSEIRKHKNGFSCPYCVGRRVLAGLNDLATVNPQLAAEWDYSKNAPVLPTEVTGGAAMKAHWLCKLGHSFQTQIAIRKQGVGCPFCAGQKVWPGFNDLATKYPNLVFEWDKLGNGGLDPSEVLAGGSSARHWICSNGHSYKLSILRRTSGGGCQICAGKTVLAGANDLATVNPELAAEWDYSKNAPLTPQQVTAGSGKVVFWLCVQGHSSSSSINNRQHGRKCAFCAGSRVIPGETDLATIYPLLASEWDYPRNHPLEPKDVFPKSSQKVSWVCPNNHSYSAIISSRSNGTGCPYCSGLRILAGWNDLATVKPYLAAEWDHKKNGELTPESVGVSDMSTAHWVCPKGHAYEQIIAYRSQAGCPQCSGRKVILGINDLATINPDLAKEWDFKKNGDLKPESVSAGSGKKIFWICDQNHSYDSAIYARMSGNGCPFCAQSGYNPSMPGLFYLISNNELRARKIGITNPDRKSDRLAGYGRTWELLGAWYSVDGSKVQNLETLMLRWIRKELGLPAFLGRKEMGKNGGHSETFSLDGPTDEQVFEKIEITIEELGIIVEPYNPIRSSVTASFDLSPNAKNS